jgi:hypothetical protein
LKSGKIGNTLGKTRRSESEKAARSAKTSSRNVISGRNGNTGF